MAIDRFSDFKPGMVSYLKWEWTGVARATSSCNAFTIARFPGF